MADQAGVIGVLIAAQAGHEPQVYMRAVWGCLSLIKYSLYNSKLKVYISYQRKSWS